MWQSDEMKIVESSWLTAAATTTTMESPFVVQHQYVFVFNLSLLGETEGKVEGKYIFLQNFCT